MSIGINDEENLLYMAGVYGIDHSKMSWEELEKEVEIIEYKKRMERLYSHHQKKSNDKLKTFLLGYSL